MATRIEQWDKAAYHETEAKEIWGNIASTIDFMKLGFRARKPDWKKLVAAMDKDRKPAKFFMKMDGLVYTFEVHVGSTKLVLNKVDIGKTGTVAEQRETLRRLSLRTEIVTKADLADFDRVHADPEDAAATIALQKEIDEHKNAIDLLRQTAQAANFRKKTVDQALFMNKDFREWAKTKGYGAFTDFLVDVDAERGWTNGILAFLGLGKRTGLKPATLLALLEASREGTKPDFAAARAEVARIVNTAMLPQYNKEGLQRIADEIKTHKAAIGALEKKVRALAA